MDPTARPRWRRTVPGVLAMVALLAGCTGAATSSDDATTGTPSQPKATVEATSPPAPTPSDEPRSDLPGGTEAVATACDEAERAALADVVQAQLDAFAEGDFAAARDLASTTFRTGIDVDAFEALISEQYPVVLDGPDATFGDCIASADRGIVAVSLAGPDGPTDLVYLLARDQDAWRIEGAQYADEPGAATSSTPGTPV